MRVARAWPLKAIGEQGTTLGPAPGSGQGDRGLGRKRTPGRLTEPRFPIRNARLRKGAGGAQQGSLPREGGIFEKPGVWRGVHIPLKRGAPTLLRGLLRALLRRGYWEEPPPGEENILGEPLHPQEKERGPHKTRKGGPTGSERRILSTHREGTTPRRGPFFGETGGKKAPRGTKRREERHTQNISTAEERKRSQQKSEDSSSVEEKDPPRGDSTHVDTVLGGSHTQIFFGGGVRGGLSQKKPGGRRTKLS